ncbi:MAG: T9SS type A sorting domain-containing protein [Ignavibacteria bacterium]|nr:T9SS type A sorting domain-containing protein [Ignavibacteria bacterium]
MTFHYRLTFFVFLLILCTTYQSIFSQNSNSKSVTYDINISKITKSDVIWEMIPLPEGEGIYSMKIMPGNKVYIGCNYGGVYRLENDDWESLGLSNKSVYDLEEYLNGELLAVSNNIYIWDYTNWTEIQNSISGSVTKTYDIFFCGGQFVDDLYRSSDGCYNWDFAHSFSSCDRVNSIVATSPDSIFLGYKDYCSGEGDVLLSIDSGLNFYPFGLQTHAISTLAIDNNNHVYAGSLGNWDYSVLPGLYKYNYQTEIWDIIMIHGTISCIEFNTENHIYIGYGWEDFGYASGVMHSEDGGESWIYDTIGMGYGIVWDLQIAENGIMYAIAGYPAKKLYRTVLPVNIYEKNDNVQLITNCFPNPASTTLIIYTNKKFYENEALSLSIYNATGMEILNYSISRKEVSNGSIELNVSDLERGVYIYCIKGEDYISTNKFIKQ